MDSPSSPPFLAARNIGKAFGHVQALAGVSFHIDEGEVLALVGDNGAGKSTLIKILSGLYRPDMGEIEIDGTPVRFDEPRTAAAHGIATVYQDLALVESRDVAANVFLGREPTWGPFVRRKVGYEQAELALERLRVSLPSVRIPVAMLSGGQRQAVAIARTLVEGARLVILDEPTAALGVSQTEVVLKLVADLREDGHGVLIITHNLRHAWEVADRFLVLHLGHAARPRSRAETTVDELVKLIVYGEDG
jgi:ABC-type sugar transport system ATPase subunit